MTKIWWGVHRKKQETGSSVDYDEGLQFLVIQRTTNSTRSTLLRITPTNNLFSPCTHLDLRNPHVLLQKSSRNARVGPVSPTNEPPREASGPESRYFHQGDDVVFTPIGTAVFIIIASNKGIKHKAGCVERKASTIECQPLRFLCFANQCSNQQAHLTWRSRIRRRWRQCRPPQTR